MKKIIKQLEKSRDLLQEKFDKMDETFGIEVINGKKVIMGKILKTR